MTEAEWLASEEPDALLGELSGRVGARQLRLAMCAFLRNDAISPLLVSKSSRRAVDVSEAYADGRVGSTALRTVRTSAHSAWAAIGPLKPSQYAAAELAHDACWLDRMLILNGLFVLRRLAREKRLAIPVALIRDIFGNPFRPVAFDPAWRTSTVVALASQMYESRDFGAMPILADALQDAGCTNEDVLTHCRDAQQVHVRGCWVVDLVLGKG
jgi:hypothetical protein